MKKLFFFKASSSNGTSNSGSSPTSDHQTFRESESTSPVANKSPSSAFRRSLSVSSGAFFGNGTEQRSSENNDTPRKSSTKYATKCRRTSTPERRSKYRDDPEKHVPCSSSKSLCSNSTTNVLDRYIDGEQIYPSKKLSSQGRLPPRFQHTAPTSPARSSTSKPWPPNQSKHPCFDSEYEHYSPRRLAKNVIEKLSQSHTLTNDFGPITIEDIYSSSVDKCCDVDVDVEKFNFANTFTARRMPLEEDDEYQEMHRKFKEAEKRVSKFSEEFAVVPHDYDGSLARKLAEEKVNLAIEVSALWKSRIHDRSLMEEIESDLIKEKSEVQSLGEKLEKQRTEEHRLRQRVRELAEKNVALQKELSSSDESEARLRAQVKHLQSTDEENQTLKQELSELQKTVDSMETQISCLKKNAEEKEKECKDQQSSIYRLSKTCNDQEKTIENLRESLGKENDRDLSDKTRKLQMEQMRLTGLELSLRRELDSCRAEVSALRHENIALLQRLKTANDDGTSFKLEEELRGTVAMIKKQTLTMLSESVELSLSLVERTKQNAVDRQFLFEGEVKAQNIRRRCENVSSTLQNVSTLMNGVATREDPPSPSARVADLQHELKAELMLSRLLKEKVYAKEMEIEVLQSDVAAAVRGSEILRCEVSNALDDLSCVSHKLKDCELQMMKKEESIYRLEVELQNCAKELSMVKGILPKVTDERDLMWEEVKQYNEKNMLLNSEISALKKKMEALDEDVLIKEGQITILKDTINKHRSFDLDSHDFLIT